MPRSSATATATQNCSIARTLAVVGERWTLLVVRELALGRTRFGDIRRNTGMSTNILSDRLHDLVDQGLVTRRPVHAPGQVHDYALTAAGRDLVPVLVALSQWGDRHAATDAGPPRLWWHTACDHPAAPHLTCGHCGRAIATSELRVAPGRGADSHQRAEGLLPAAHVDDGSPHRGVSGGVRDGAPERVQSVVSRSGERGVVGDAG